jgi:restriction system-associated AAA family ATPase
MKLLKLKIGNIPKEKQFRSLHSGFEIEFHKLYTDSTKNELDQKGILAMETFSPFCFAGINGSGKSNVLEALAIIFFHLESCVAKFKPKTFEKYFRPEECNLDAFTLEYLIARSGNNESELDNLFKITIIKNTGKAPKMYRQSYPFSNNEKTTEESFYPSNNNNYQEPAPAKIYLPDIIVGYSSGENEILSLPFRKSRLINFDKYREDYKEKRPFEEPENSLIYIDSEMSQAVLLASLLYEDEKTLKPIRDELGIIGLKSFRMNLNCQGLKLFKENYITSTPIFNHINEIIESLKKCASTWHEEQFDIKDEFNGPFFITTLDFIVDGSTKKVFKDHFKTSFELFRFFQVLYELNANVISENIKEEVYKSKGFYTDGKLPEGSPNENVFYFLDFLIFKEIKGELDPKPLLLREFSDGEHQFLHTLGICLMLKERRSLLLLDEPETHFNPSWRAKFIKILEDGITAGNTNDDINGRLNVNLLKDILLTTHSPFIISDCKPENVLFFNKNEETKLLEVKKASELGFKTYGSSVDYILKIFYKTNLISNKSFDDLKDIIDNGNIDQLRKAVEDFGESSEKQFLFKKIYEKMKKNDDN